MGLVASMGMAGNMMLKSYRQARCAGRPQGREGAGRGGHASSWRSLPPTSPTPRCAACPAATSRRCWWAARSPPPPTVLMAALSGPRPGYQLLLHHLSPAQRAEGKGRCRHLCGRGSGRAAGAVRPYPGPLRRPGVRHCGGPHRHQGAGGPHDDQIHGKEGPNEHAIRRAGTLCPPCQAQDGLPGHRPRPSAPPPFCWR